MTKYLAREKEVVDAYQFTGGAKAANDIARMINQMSSANAKVNFDIDRNEFRISVVTDTFGEYLNTGDWFLIRDDRNDVTHMTNEDFEAKYGKLKQPHRKLVWKDIPDFPGFQISDNGRVRDSFFSSYVRRTKAGDFILRTPKGERVRWHESKLGDEEFTKNFIY